MICLDANFVVASCCCDNLYYHQWRQSKHHDDTFICLLSQFIDSYALNYTWMRKLIIGNRQT